jgi:hypothetical protein
MGNKYNNRAYTSIPPGAFYHIAATDFGVAVPAAATLVLETGSGSLGTGTTAVAISWITPQGVSLIGATAVLATPTNTDALNVTIPSPPAALESGQRVIGWQLYSANSTSLPAAALLAQNTGTTTIPVAGNVVYTVGQYPLTEPDGAAGGALGIKDIVGFLLTTTTILLKSVGVGSAVPQFDTSGIQLALPAVPANSGADYYAIVPSAGFQWQQGKSVSYMNPDGIPETEGIALNHLDCVWLPNYPGATISNPPSSAYTQVSVAPGAFMSLNQVGFQAVQTSSASTAAAFIGASAFNYSKGSTTTDGGVTWLSLGGPMVQVRFAFTNLTGGTLTPAVRAYELFCQ